MSYAVTIGIPVYNAHKFIGRALDTALSQTFTNLEVLIVDDCSTDDTLTIIEQYQKTHQRGNCIRVLRQEKNGGPSAARNRMIDEARGHFLYFMDVDDTIPVFAIATLYDAAVGYRAETCGDVRQTSHYQPVSVPFASVSEEGRVGFLCLSPLW